MKYSPLGVSSRTPYSGCSCRGKAHSATRAKQFPAEPQSGFNDGKYGQEDPLGRSKFPSRSIDEPLARLGTMHLFLLIQEEESFFRSTSWHSSPHLGTCTLRSNPTSPIGGKQSHICIIGFKICA